MARLTNKQLEVLSTSIVDKLEEEYLKRKETYEESEAFKKQLEALNENEDYIKLIEIDKEINNYKNKINDLENQVEQLCSKYDENNQYFYYSYHRKNPSQVMGIIKNKYLKFNENFDREKMLTKIQADILLDDQYDAIETYQKLTKKYAQGTNRELFSK